MKSNKILKKSLISTIIFIIFVTIVFYFIFKEINIIEVFNILKTSKKSYLIIAIIFMSFFSICEAVNLKSLLRLFGEKISFFKCYKYALSGFFICGITPSSSGGDPMQLYLMTKDKVPVSHSAITLLTKLLAFQLVTISVAIVSFIFSYDVFNVSLGNIKYLIYLGILLNFLMLLFYLLVIFCNKIIIFLVDILSNLLNKIHYKKVDLIKDKLYKLVDEYATASNILKNNKLVFFKIILITLIQMISYFSIPYFVYLALGLSEQTIFNFIAIQSVLFVSVSSLPFPGAVGISEAAFMNLYKNIYNNITLGSAMIMTRFISFYIFVIYSGLMFLIFILKDNFCKKGL